MLIKIDYVASAEIQDISPVLDMTKLLDPGFNLKRDTKRLRVISKSTTINTDHILFIDHEYSKAQADQLHLAIFTYDVIASDYCFDMIKMTDGRCLIVTPETTEKIICDANDLTPQQM